MAEPITFTVTGLAETQAKFLRMPESVKQKVREAVKDSAVEVQRGAMLKLSDDVLHVRTGRLRRSINVRLSGADYSPQAAVGTNVEYAAIHELGFTGTESVKAHVRRIFYGRSGEVVQGLAKLGGVLKRVASTGEVEVRAFTREVHMPERSFLRSTLAEHSDAIRARISAALAGATE